MSETSGKKWLARIALGTAILLVAAIVASIVGFFWWSNRMEDDARPHLEYALELAQNDERAVAALGEPIGLRSYGMGGAGGQLKDGSFNWVFSGMLEGADRQAGVIVKLTRTRASGWQYEKVTVTVFPDDEEFELEVDGREPAAVRHPFRPLITLNEGD